MARLTILLLCWNHERYLEQAIAGLAEQRKRDFNVVFLDNVSSDDSVGLARRLLERSGLDFQMIENERPRTISANLNAMLARATGDLVTFHSTDDWLAPRYVEAMIEAADRNPDAGWFSGGGWRFDDVTGTSEAIETAQFAGREDILSELKAGREPFFFAGHCYRRSELEAIGGWDGDQSIEDADLFFRLAQRTRHVIVHEKLFHYRKHAGGASSDPAYMIAALEKFLAKHRASFTRRQLRQRRSDTLRIYASLHADRGETAAAIKAAFEALVLMPTEGKKWRTLIYAWRSLGRRERGNR